MVRRLPWWRPAVDVVHESRVMLTWRWVSLDLWVPYWRVGPRLGLQTCWPFYRGGTWRVLLDLEVVLAPLIAVWVVVEKPEQEEERDHEEETA